MTLGHSFLRIVMTEPNLQEHENELDLYVEQDTFVKSQRTFTYTTIEELRKSILRTHALQVINTTFPLIRKGGTKTQIDALNTAWINIKTYVESMDDFIGYPKNLSVKAGALKSSCQKAFTWWSKLFKTLKDPNEDQHKVNCGIYISCCIVYMEHFWYSDSHVFCPDSREALSSLLSVIADVNIDYYDPECCNEVAEGVDRLLDSYINPTGSTLMSMAFPKLVLPWEGELRITFKHPSK